MSDLVGNPEDRFSQNEARFVGDCTAKSAKDSHIFSTTNNSVFNNVVGIIVYLKSRRLNDVVRITML